jgi:hypothetical protein
VLAFLAGPLSSLLESDGPLQLSLGGLEIMNDDPAAAHVLYLGVRGGEEEYRGEQGRQRREGEGQRRE